MRPVTVVVLFLFFIWSVFTATSAYSQSVKFSLTAGAQYGPYAMDDLRKYRDFVVRASPLQPFLKNTYDFPAQPCYEIAALLKMGRWHAGITAWRVSTGARSDYEDYSGFYRFDIITTMNAVLLRAHYDIIKRSEHGVFASLQAGAGFNRVSFKEDFDIGDFADATTIKFESRNWIVMPGAGYRYEINSHLAASIEARYHMDISPEGLAFESSNEPLRFPGQNDVRVEWKGLRAALNLAYVF